MPLITPSDLISFALRASGVLGVGQSPLAEDISDAFSALNGMMAIWNRRRWLVYHLIDVPVITTGQQAYSVGPGGDFNVPRPDRLEAAYFRQIVGSGFTPSVASNQALLLDGIGGGLLLDGIGDGLLLDGYGSAVNSAAVSFSNDSLLLDGGNGALFLDGVGGDLFLDGYGAATPIVPVANNALNYSVDYPLDLLESREDYSDIPLKRLGSWPSCIFYDSAWPYGYVYPWPIPQASLYELHIVIKDTLSSFTSLTQQINLPPEYIEPLWTNLCIRLAPLYQFKVSPEVVGLAKGGLSTLRSDYAQIPRLSMPSAVLGKKSKYNIYSDSQYS